MPRFPIDSARFGHWLCLLAAISLFAGLPVTPHAADLSKTEVEGLIHCPELDLLYDDNERIRERRSDSNADCQIDQIVEYENEKAIRARQDRNYDGQEDAWTEFDAQGRPHRESFDETGDGQVDTWQERKAGVLSQKREDLNG